MAEIKNLKEVASRILKAIKKKEKIILYGDADLDGIAAVIILEETIKNLGGETIAIYFPDRETEGYGISETGLNHLKNFAPALLVALDCGIGNFKEVKMAKNSGLEVIIIDHHQVLDKLPQAKIIVDPKQKGDRYPFKELATAGIIFKLSELLLKKNLTKNLKQNFLELAALATIADMMPQEAENKIFIEEGFKSIENSWRPGIRALFQEETFKKYHNLPEKISKMISILNVREAYQNLPANFRLLTSPALDESKEIIERLLAKSEIRKQKIEEITQEVQERIDKFKEENPIVFEGSASWDFAFISPVASIICQRYKKPVFIFKILEKESQGTVRVPQGIDSVYLMKQCSKHLLTYGGHPLASGFRIKNENLEQFKACLIFQIKHFKKCGK